ncbi:hypothetical protein NX059_007675 [Plenodomus lindquistii]|nr:hypothetical protein NX059_007675 [Plenodomus lindquistii]
MIAQIRRNQDMTPSEFRNHYDTVHVPLLKSLVGPAFPLTHTRHYITRLPKSPFPAVRYREGYKGSEVEFDALTIMVFRDTEHFKEFRNAFAEKEVQRQMREDGAIFLDEEWKMACAVDEPVVTTLDE